MNGLIQIVMALAIVLILLLFLELLVILVASLKSKAIIRQINAGKISDHKLTHQYNNFKKWKDNKLVAILMAGIAYKFYIKMQNILFEAYKQGMIKRNLPL
ncbi:hypothetical protein A9G11_08885 [Gilliamella sp. wkB108]|uniref:hypothetical protein n=1 Tax=Gilliamella sp. wkB108 TaxID=3120256 RepID=UPI00080E8B14|nr:hypothetical protein [Gilliamella apicola]OCG21042.1 hypothetical protein A9G11_08885 [Gilliamella apicola]